MGRRRAPQRLLNSDMKRWTRNGMMFRSGRLGHFSATNDGFVTSLSACGSFRESAATGPRPPPAYL